VTACRTGLCGRGGGRHPAFSRAATLVGSAPCRCAGEDRFAVVSTRIAGRVLDLPLTSAAPAFRGGGHGVLDGRDGRRYLLRSPQPQLRLQVELTRLVRWCLRATRVSSEAGERSVAAIGSLASGQFDATRARSGGGEPILYLARWRILKARDTRPTRRRATPSHH
jgi:hypothetical protein